MEKKSKLWKKKGERERKKHDLFLALLDLEKEGDGVAKWKRHVGLCLVQEKVLLLEDGRAYSELWLG